MAASRPQRLPKSHARDVVIHSINCLQRASIVQWHLFASYPLEGFKRVYDTLILQFKPTSQHQDEFCHPAESVREALVLLQTLSYCVGYSFHENLAFWNETLKFELTNGAQFAPRRFPRMVLDWNPGSVAKDDKSTSLQMLKTNVLELFTIDTVLSVDGKALLELMSTFVASSRPPIDCVVSIRFERTVHATKALMDTVVSFATTMLVNETECLTWTGVHMIGHEEPIYARDGCTITNFTLLSRLCRSLPSRFSVNLSFPKPSNRLRKNCGSNPPNRSRNALIQLSMTRALTSFLIQGIGVAGTELRGRLTELDLTHWCQKYPWFAHVCFLCLCSLLPFSRSLRKLRIFVPTTADLLWLMYAMVHPLTQSTPWRALYMDGVYQRLDWNAALQHVHSPSFLMTLWSQLFPSTTAVKEPSEYTQEYVRRTAHIASKAEVRSPDKSAVLAHVHVGVQVELCDTTTPIYELMQVDDTPDTDDVAVLVAGVGFGWIDKRHLTQIEEISYDSD